MPPRSSQLTRRLLGLTAHPGGATATLAAVSAATLGPGERVLDVGCGSGRSALLLARETGARVVGVELDGRAALVARRAGLDVIRGDALELPVPDGTYDVVLCEVALSQTAAPARAVSEMARALRPGGRLVICDVAVELDLARRHPRVDAAVRLLATPLSSVGYADLAARARLAVVHTESRPADLMALVADVERRLRLTSVVPGARSARAAARECGTAIADGSLGYLVLVAHKPSGGAGT